MADAPTGKKTDFTKMDAPKLQSTIMELRKEQLDSRFAKAMGTFEGAALNAARTARKNIARAKTQLAALKKADAEKANKEGGAN